MRWTVCALPISAVCLVACSPLPTTPVQPLEPSRRAESTGLGQVVQHGPVTVTYPSTWARYPDGKVLLAEEYGDEDDVAIAYDEGYENGTSANVIVDRPPLREQPRATVERIAGRADEREDQSGYAAVEVGWPGADEAWQVRTSTTGGPDDAVFDSVVMSMRVGEDVVTVLVGGTYPRGGEAEDVLASTVVEQDPSALPELPVDYGELDFG